MLEITRIRENKDVIIEQLKVRNFDAREKIETILVADENWRANKRKLETVLAESNNIAKEIGQLFREGKQEEATKAKARGAALKDDEKELNDSVNQYAQELQDLLYEIPNIPHPSVPKGNSDEDNEIINTSGSIPVKAEFWLPHWELAKKYDLIDFELGVKVTGAGFPFYKGKGARLQRALINFFLDQASDAGYQEIIPPFLVNEASGYGTGQLPDKEGQMYHDAQDDLYLIPTAEVPLTNMYRDVLLKETDI
ncbi:serine--tRNA ligase, partial [Crocinitomix sp.]|nr:serine--tRNA ligase [Crocinitomix sp.]